MCLALENFNCINQAYQRGQKHTKDAWLSAVSRYLGPMNGLALDSRLRV